MGGTALHSAAMSGNEEVVKLLIGKGADVNAKDKWGRTALDLAKRFNKQEMIDLLKKHGAREESPKTAIEKWREKFQSMSEEEREKLREQMRKRFEDRKKQEKKE